MGDTQEGDDSHAMRTTEQDEVRQLEQQLKDLSVSRMILPATLCSALLHKKRFIFIIEITTPEIKKKKSDAKILSLLVC